MSDIGDELSALGYRTGPQLGSGMESVVLALVDDPTRVIKVWSRRERSDLVRLQQFTAALADAGLAVPFPRVHELIDLDERIATVETAVPGTPLGSPGGPHPVTESDARVLTEALAALAAVRPNAGLALLPPLPGEAPFEPTTAFSTSLAALLRSRHQAFGAVMARVVPDIDRCAAATVRALQSVGPRPTGLIHGDLVPPNVMVGGEKSRLTGLLDFGFLTVLGDPAFDAAVTASIYDMYGEHARRSEAVLDELIIERFGYPRRLFGIYRAAYAIITANVFSADGADGHFAWCMQMLQRSDVGDAVAG